MSYEVVFSPEASRHLQDLEDYLAERFYPVNALRHVQRVTTACVRLGEVSQVGTRRDDLAPGLRMIGFEGRVAIYFTVADDKVMIVGVLYGGKTFRIPQ